MKQLHEYCSNLLMMHECVVIPDFGAFITRKKPSFYSEESEKFFPPSREISFNISIKKDDGLLANHISLLLDISFAEAREFISGKVIELTNIIENQRSANFGSIGKFLLETDNNLVFIPTADFITTPVYYGFPVISVSQLDEYRRKEQIRNVVSSIPRHTGSLLSGIALFIALSIVPLQVTRQSLVQQQKAFIQFQNRSIEYNASSRDSISELIDEMTLKENALAITGEENKSEKNLTEKAVDPVVVPVVTEEVKEDKKISEVKKPEIKTTNASEPGYYLIAGSFVEMWRAEQFMKEMRVKGFEPVVVDKDNKLRVAVYYSSEKNSADTKLSEMRNSNPEMPVWLLKK